MDDNILGQVIMAVDIRSQQVGCAYYVIGEGRLFCMEQVVGGEMDIIEKCEAFVLSPKPGTEKCYSEN
jgi:hypothetical protein